LDFDLNVRVGVDMDLANANAGVREVVGNAYAKGNADFTVKIECRLTSIPTHTCKHRFAVAQRPWAPTGTMVAWHLNWRFELVPKRARD